MKRVTRIGLLILLLAVCILSLPSPRLAAQTAAEQEGPAAFVPTEKLPAGSAVSFPIDI